MASQGEQFARAFAAVDYDAAREVLAPTVPFRGLTPGRLFEAEDAGGVLDVLRYWNDNAPGAAVDAIEHLDRDVAGDRHAVRYRVRWHSPEDGAFVFEQQAYYDLDDEGRISWMHLVCSGDRRPSSEATA